MRLAADNYVPQVVTTRRPLIAWTILLTTALAVVSLVVAAPLLAAARNGWSIVIYQAFGFLCHQLPERSFFIDGHKFAVCSRCSGLYLGATVTLLFYPLLRSLRVAQTPDRKWLFGAAVPLFVDFFLTFVGIWENTHTTRFVTGFLFGSVVVFYVIPGVVELSLRNWKRQVSTSEPARGAPSLAIGPSDYSAPERRI
ncbi:MAG TPA: DUF2085 domain-containing protein [Pyrinomonadaceae bacterium]